MQRVGVVGAAIVRDGRLLASRRREPPRLAGMWELPGGKVEDGETDQQALRREVLEELRLEVVVGARVGAALDLDIGGTAELRVYRCTVAGPPGESAAAGGDGRRRGVPAEPALLDHDEHRWLLPSELDQVRWLPVDLPLLGELREVI